MVEIALRIRGNEAKSFATSRGRGPAGLNLKWCGRNTKAEGRLPDGAAPVERRRAQLAQRALMLERRIADIAFPAIAGPFARMLGHDPVACHLGDDRGGGDRPALASPPTIAIEGRSHLGQRLPSTSTIAGSMPSASTARIIASILAQKMLIWSISSTLAMPTPITATL